METWFQAKFMKPEYMYLKYKIIKLMVASSQASRLKSHSAFTKSKITNWTKENNN